MRRFLSPWALSVGGLIVGMTATAATAWVVASQGHNIGVVSRSMVTSTYPDEVIPRVLIGAVFVWAAFHLFRPGSRRQVFRAAAICAVIGTLVAVYVVIRAEIAFVQAFPDDGAAGGWAPGAARAEFLPLSYLTASFQAVVGFLASTALLAISTLRRSPT